MDSRDRQRMNVSNQRPRKRSIRRFIFLLGHMRFAEPPGVTARLESRKVATAATPEDKDWMRELYAMMKPGQGTGTVQAVQARYHVHTTSGRSSF